MRCRIASCRAITQQDVNLWQHLYRPFLHISYFFSILISVCVACEHIRTVEVDGDVNDTTMVVTDKHLTIAAIHCTRRLNCCWARTITPIYTSVTTYYFCNKNSELLTQNTWKWLDIGDGIPFFLQTFIRVDIAVDFFCIGCPQEIHFVCCYIMHT